MTRLLVPTTLALLLMAAAAAAHHSGAMFNDQKTVTVTGVVVEFQYSNPHSWLKVDVKGPDGKVVTWGFEAEGPSTLLRAGIKRSDLKPGMQVTVSGHPMHDGRPAATLVKAVRLSDRKEFVPAKGFAVK
jgi:hypothetical protein